MGELNVDGTTGPIQGLSLRLYNAESGQWRIHWASSRDGELGEPMVGGFVGGIGGFHNQEPMDGRIVDFRFLFTDLEPDTFKLEQALSDDGGECWEANWIARFQRVRAPAED